MSALICYTRESASTAMLSDELLTYLFDGQPHRLVGPMTIWLASSRRFAAFVDTFRTKIRKKLRVTQDAEALADLGLELETAYLLLQERTLSLVYESQPNGQVRWPDFAVTFTTSLTFMVEVTRLRSAATSTTPQILAQTPITSSLDNVIHGERLAETICSKLGQLLPQCSNVLIIGMDAPRLTQSELYAMMLRIQQRAERNDSAVWQRHRFKDRADFFRHYRRLSEVLVRGLSLQADDPVIVWVNPQARQPLPPKVQTALYRSHTA